MALKEKFIEKLLEVDEINGSECEQIADDYAIDFAKWCDNIRIEEWIDKTHKELLEIFKKERNL
jgi:hypothetical protein